ncbi:hypothetical protein FQN55_002116 [Onygenales sp. PD_40]|nr:hypothetical protein FQN55_002116 [Onygenales sp. PD_40]
MSNSNEPFYVRYYSGHSGRFGHEFLEFDFRSLGDGRSASARYANNSNYRNDSLIRKEMCVSSLMIAEIKRIIKESEIMKEDDSKWPQKNKDGRQELEIRLGNDHISFETAKIGSLVDVTESADPEGLRVFYYLVQDLKALVFSLISLHFKACSPYFPSPGQTVTNAAPSRSNRFKRISLAKKLNAKWHVFLDTSPSMPTPSVNPPRLSSAYPVDPVSTRTSCPPEIDRIAVWRASEEERVVRNVGDDAAPSPSTASGLPPSQLNQPQDVCSQPAPALGIDISSQSSSQTMNTPDDDITMGSSSPAASVATDAGSPAQPYHALTPTSTGSSMGYEFSNVRLLPNHCSSYLRPGSKFVGTQRSERQTYNVDVEIKHVDMAESYLCGYLGIQGLTEDHPTLTTFFEGEIIGTKYTFVTQHESWGATDRTDMQHWAQFDAWRPLAKIAKKPDFTFKNFAQRENIFMRWKEYFLVPDHRVRTISGASFEGFYYICFNQVKGTVSGIYFHAKSEKYQQLELKHVDNRGCFGAMEFR